MKQVIEKQTALLEKIYKTLSFDKVTQLSQAALQLKTDSDLNRDEKETHKKLDGIHAVLKNSLAIFKKLEPDQSKAILNKSRENREFKTIGSRLQESKGGVKDFFTGRGFLDKTGISKRGSGGIISEYLDAKEDRRQYAKARIEAGDPTVKLYGAEKATKIFERQRGEQQQLRREQGAAERKIKTYRELGISEKQIEKSKEFKQLEQTAIKLAQSDPALRPEGFDVKTGIVKPTAEKIEKSSNRANKPSSESVSSEENMLEAQRSRDMQIELLTKIEENTALAAGVDSSKAKPKKEEAGGGVLNAIMGFLGDGLMTALKSMFSLKNILKVLGKVALPAMIIGSLVNGIMDGFNTFMETGSIGEALIAGLGGVLEFLSFGLFDAKTIRSIADAVSGFVDDYIINPIKNFFGFLWDTYKKYVIDPLLNFFAPLVDFFKNIKDQMLSMVESIGIPEISFTIPIIDKKVSIGPFYPFKKESVKAESAAPTNSSAGAGRSSSQEASVDPRRLDTVTSSTEAPKLSTVTGRSSSQEASVDPRRLDTVTSSAEAPKLSTGAIVYNKSAENANAANATPAAAPVIISAPTTNNSSKQNITMPMPIRNDDSGYNRYVMNRGVMI